MLRTHTHTLIRVRNTNNTVAILAQDCHKIELLVCRPWLTIVNVSSSFRVSRNEAMTRQGSLSGSTSRLHLQSTPYLLLSWISRQNQQFTPSPLQAWSTLRRHLQFLIFLLPSWKTLRQHQQCFRLSPVVAPVVEYIAPAPAVQRLSSDVEYIAPATPICRPTPFVEYIAPVPTSTPSVSSSPSPSVQSRQSAHRVSTEVPTVSSRHHDEWLHAERVLRARSAPLQANEGKGHAVGSAADQPWESV